VIFDRIFVKATRSTGALKEFTVSGSRKPAAAAVREIGASQEGDLRFGKNRWVIGGDAPTFTRLSGEI
jgi:hypothetical protein